MNKKLYSLQNMHTQKLKQYTIIHCSEMNIIFQYVLLFNYIIMTISALYTLEYFLSYPTTLNYPSHTHSPYTIS